MIRLGQAKKWWRLSILLTLLFAIGLGLGFSRWRHRISPVLMLNMRAGWAAHAIADPDERLRKFLEERYGSLADPQHRQAAFLGFFDHDQIQAFQILVKHAPESRRQSSIDAMARWLAAYRASLSADERAALAARFQGPEGQAILRRATAQYNTQDVRYRGNTAPVISQLLKTLSDLD